MVIQNILEESDFKTKSVKNAQVQQVTSSLLEDLRTLYDSYLHKMVYYCVMNLFGRYGLFQKPD